MTVKRFPQTWSEPSVSGELHPNKKDKLISFIHIYTDNV